MADREAKLVQLAEYRRERPGCRAVDGQLAGVAISVEAVIGDGQKTQLRKGYRAAGMPCRVADLGPHGSRQRVDRGMKRGERPDH